MDDIAFVNVSALTGQHLPGGAFDGPLWAGVRRYTPNLKSPNPEPRMSETQTLIRSPA